MLPIQIVVGAGGYNPSDGDDEYNNPSLAGLSGYVEKSGYGAWGYENYEVLDTGGFRLLNGLVFSEADVYFFVAVGSAYNDDAVTGYTNGFNFNKVVTSLFGRVGWKQTPDAPTLNSTNLTARSGRKFNDGSFHSLVTLNNIKGTMEEKNPSDDNYNAYLVSLQRSVILRCLNGVFSEPEYISQALAYDRTGYGNNDQAITNNSMFVGWQIKLPSRVDIGVQIDSVALYFDSVATFNLYVFADNKTIPVFTQEVTTVANGQTVVDLSDCFLNYIGGDNHGGIFYLGYFQDDLGDTKAIWETDIDFSCGKVYGLAPVECTATGEADFNKKTVNYSWRTNGINPHISAFRDHTWQIMKKAQLFDNAIGLQMAAQVIEGTLYATRSNGTERILKNELQLQATADLTGVTPITDGPPNTIGMRKQIDQELTRVKKSFFPKEKSVTLSLC